MRYAKLYDGYSLGSLDMAQDITQFYKSSISKRLPNFNVNDYNADNVLIKELSSAIGRFYRIVFTKVIKLSITVFVNSQGVMTINGVEAVPTYYITLTDNKFKSYG